MCSCWDLIVVGVIRSTFPVWRAHLSVASLQVLFCSCQFGFLWFCPGCNSCAGHRQLCIALGAFVECFVEAPQLLLKAEELDAKVLTPDLGILH